jgi:serine/threonine-protein kinase
MKITLNVVKGPEQGRQFVFEQPDTFLVGRAKDCHFRLPNDDPYVSRRHFLIELCPPKCFLKDLNSTNPPHVNGKRVMEQELKNGDMIVVGYTLLGVTISEQVREVCCKKCGTAIPVAGDDSPELCDACRALTPPSLSSQTFKCTCGTCGRDLTTPANSDGRAGDLFGEVEYACPSCLSLKGAEEQIKGYIVLKNLGHGGMGKVDLVYHPATARVLIMKKILKLENEQLVKRFEREVRFTQGLVHPNLVRYVDSGIDGREPFLVMQYVRGSCLGNLLLARNKPLEPGEAVNYIVGALQGLEVMHKHGVIHRDIKPENILIKPDPKGKAAAKLADFGLAKKYAESGGAVLTQRGMILGSILHMSPEQIKDCRNVREPADTYSMGVTLYYLLSGQFPYDFPTKLNLQNRQLNDMKGYSLTKIQQLIVEEKRLNAMNIILSNEPLPILKRKSSIPKKLAQVVDKSIIKDIGSRYQSAADFRKDLLKAL